MNCFLRNMFWESVFNFCMFSMKIFGINHPRNFWKFWNFYNFIIFKNAFGQFMLNRALKHVSTSANYKINSKTFLPQIFLPLILHLIISFLSSFNGGKIKFWWIMKIIHFRLYGILPVSKVFTVAVVTVRAVFWPEINVSNKSILKYIIYINIIH